MLQVAGKCRKRQAEFVSGETAKPSLGDLEDLPVDIQNNPNYSGLGLNC